MIAVDTSALIAMLAGETTAPACRRIMEDEEIILISTGTMVEALIVAARRDLLHQMRELLASPAIRSVDVNARRARLAAEAYTRWGKGFHPAGLNYGDCFSYVTAREFDCPLLYVGNDFSQTDLVSAIDAARPTPM